MGGKLTLEATSANLLRPLLAQLDRASGFEPEGWGFESLGAGHLMVAVGRKQAQSCLRFSRFQTPRSWVRDPACAQGWRNEKRNAGLPS